MARGPGFRRSKFPGRSRASFSCEGPLAAGDSARVFTRRSESRFPVTLCLSMGLARSVVAESSTKHLAGAHINSTPLRPLDSPLLEGGGFCGRHYSLCFKVSGYPNYCIPVEGLADVVFS